MTTVFQQLIWALQPKRPRNAPFRTAILEAGKDFEVVFEFPCIDPEIYDRSTVEADLFMLDQWLYEHSATVRHAHRAGEYRLIVRLSGSDGQTGMVS